MSDTPQRWLELVNQNQGDVGNEVEYQGVPVSGAKESVEAMVASISSKATTGGSAAVVAAWWTNVDWGLWIGLAIGVTGLLVNWHYKRKSDRRAEEVHRAHLLALAAGQVEVVVDRS